MSAGGLYGSASTPAQFQTIAKIAHANIQWGHSVTDWVTPTALQLNTNTLEALARRGMVMFDRSLDVVRLTSEFAGEAQAARDFWYFGVPL